MSQGTPRKANTDEAIEKEMDLIIARHTISDLESQGEQGIPELIHFLSDPIEEVARQATLVLKRIIPLASMLERWEVEYPTPGDPAQIPQWIIDSCRGWGTDDDFPSQCARVFLGLSNDPGRCERFLHRMASFPGAQRRFTKSLAASGKTEAVVRFQEVIEEQESIHFPPQLGISPTMNCQLHCDFCVSAGHQQHKEAPLSSLVDILDWTVKNGVTRIGFSGGEPTLYSDFAPLIDHITDRELEYFMATNGIVAPQVLETMCTRKPQSVTLHLTSEVLEGDLLASFIQTTRRLVQEDIYVVLRINIRYQDMDVRRYLDVASETGIREVRAAVPMPNAFRYNAYISLDQLSAYGESLGQYVDEGKRRGLETILAKPFPLCQMPERAARIFLCNGSVANNCPVHRGRCANNVVVMPDGSCIPCLGLNQSSPKPITDYSTLQEVGDVFYGKVQRASAIPLLELCLQCPFWCGGRCLGGCLSYRLITENEKIV